MMLTEFYKSSIKTLQLSLGLLSDVDSGGSKPEAEAVKEKIKTHKSRRIPLVNFIPLLAIIALIIAILEYYI